MTGLFVTGTDTGVGKTYVSTLLVRQLRRSGVDCGAFKPICCGDRDDAESLVRACDGAVDLNDANPVWLRAPASPYAASLIENRMVDLALIRQKQQELRTKFPFLLIEGAGGWRVPITASFSMADLAVEFALPVLLIAANRLGCLNHTLLTLEAIKHDGLSCVGVVMNSVQDAAPDVSAATNVSILETLCEVPVFSLDFNSADLGRLVPHLSAS